MKNQQAQTKTITVKTDEQNPIDAEILASAIVKVSNQFEAIRNSSLKERAVVTLLHDITKVPRKDIELILHYGSQLKRHYIKDIPPSKQ